ncbi:MAG: type IX secretion system sortase PorU [Prevotella sp.]|nr:type IX secretion system sortase PorU [Prevotella sp.]
MKKRFVLMLFCMLAGVVNISAQDFFNLTASEVKIDSVLPFFSRIYNLDAHYADSAYSVTIAYPEFIDMSEADIERYHQITSSPLPALPVVEQHIGVSRKQASLHVGFVPLVYRDGKYQKLVSFKLKVQAVPLSKRQALMRRAAEKRYADHSVLASGQWAKISIPETGIYQITEALIRQAGFSNINKVKVYGYGGALQPDILTGDYLASTDDLKEVPQCVVNGKRLFHAVGPVGWGSATATERNRNFYADYGCYFLTETDDEPLTVDSLAFVYSFYPTNNDYHTLHEVDDFAWYHSGRNLSESTLLTASGISYRLSSHTANGQLTVKLTSDNNFEVEVLLNGTSLGTMSNISGLPSYSKAIERSKTFAIDGLLTETNNVTLRLKSGSAVRLDYLCLTHPTPAAMPSLSQTSFKSPNFVYRITNQDHHADQPADMVIIIPTSQKVLSQALRLKELHEKKDSMRVTIVPADELFNEFSSGTPDANAYRRYLKMLYDRADNETDAPRYLLLFGDGAWDNRMRTLGWRTYSADDFLLCHEGENSFSETDSYVTDDYFCLLDDGEGAKLTVSDKVDVGVGRLTARTEEEAKVMVDKIVSYRNNEMAGAWQNTLCFLGDDGNDNDHMRAAETAAAAIEKSFPNYLIKRIYWDAYPRVVSSTGYSYPEVENIVKQQMKDGALIMDYCGHGAAYCLSHEMVLQRTDFEQQTSMRLPLWITASCDIMPYDSQEENIGETAMLNPKGGAIAFFGTTRTVWSYANREVNRAFLKNVLASADGKRNTLGDAVRLTKNEVWNNSYPYNKLHYTLLGDPALSLATPTAEMVVDSINGKAVAEGVVTLNAGDRVVVKGHVVNAATSNGVDDQFNGVVSMTVKDVEETIVCRQNDDVETYSAFVYKDRPNVLYVGSDSVRSGHFTISFAMPSDISYGDDKGLINLYAYNDSGLEAQGRNESFVMKGNADQTNDGIGPSIYCYLNNSSFTNGDAVNSTPYFFAEITDKDGINASGSGLGHDLELIIDNDPMKTYRLNDYFHYAFGEYTSGTAGYSIPTLSEGPHTLLFRAWDVLNNASTAELKFNVVKGLTPQCFSVMCTKNPATTSTSFIINHDRTGSNMDVVVEVFDMSGRQLWTHSESGVSTDNTYTVNWNLTVEGGSKLQTGVYLYRVLIASDGSRKASQANKLIILRQ